MTPAMDSITNTTITMMMISTRRVNASYRRITPPCTSPLNPTDTQGGLSVVVTRRGPRRRIQARTTPGPSGEAE